MYVSSDKLGSLLETSKATRLSEKIYDILDSLRSNQQKTTVKKRHHEPEHQNPKKSKLEENGIGPTKDPVNKEKSAKDQLSENQVMLLNTVGLIINKLVNAFSGS